MAALALAVSFIALVLSIVSLRAYVSLRRRLRRPSAFSPFSDELLTRDAWLEEIEERGQAVLARIAEAEQRLKAAQAAGAPAPEGGLAAVLRRDEARPRPKAAEGTGSRLEQAAVREQVLRLAAQGLDVTAIAQKLQLGRGEVELFLGLAARENPGK